MAVATADQDPELLDVLRLQRVSRPKVRAHGPGHIDRAVRWGGFDPRTLARIKVDRDRAARPIPTPAGS